MSDGPTAPPLSLTLFRHAKSDRSIDYGEDDQRRPLSRRGCRAARAMGRFLAKTGEEVPDLALTSPAIRAKRTLQLAARAGLWGCPVHERPALYGDVSDLLGEIRSTSDDVRNLLLVGHEPAWSTAARLLSGAAQIRLPTASMLRLGFAVDRWSQIEEGGARIDWLVVPRLLESPRRGRA